MASADFQSAIRNPQSAMLLRGFAVVAAHAFGRHWRVRQMGFVALALLALVVASVAVVGTRPGGWGFEDRQYRRTGMTYRQAAEAFLPAGRYDAYRFLVPNPSAIAVSRVDAPPEAYLFPRPWDPLANGVQSLLLSIPHAVVQSEQFLADWRFLNFSRWVVLGSYLGFVLPLFTLAYAGGAIGAEREGRTLVWLLTRPLPRPAIYLATFVGTLPWCLLFGVGGFVLLCAAGGNVGAVALRTYWPAAVAGTVALASLFHLFGAVFRRPVVVGLVYVFFYEALVAALPGSLKKFSLNFYTRSLMHDEAQTAGFPGAMLDVAGPVTAETAWAVLLSATAVLLTTGMVLFARGEPRDDV